jgi:hypothetical protein
MAKQTPYEKFLENTTGMGPVPGARRTRGRPDWKAKARNKPNNARINRESSMSSGKGSGGGPPGLGP